MNEMEKNRKIISEIDEQMAGLFEKRMNARRNNVVIIPNRIQVVVLRGRSP